MSNEDEVQDLECEEAHEQMINKVISLLAEKKTFADVVRSLMSTVSLEKVAAISDGDLSLLP